MVSHLLVMLRLDAVGAVNVENIEEGLRKIIGIYQAKIIAPFLMLI